MVVKQCINCKNSNPQCRKNFTLYLGAVNAITSISNDSNYNNHVFFKNKEEKRFFDFELKCSHYIPKENNQIDNK